MLTVVLVLHFLEFSTPSGKRDYSSAVDIWSLACVYAELLLGKQLFSGICDIDMLFQIFSVCGTPTKESWPAFDKTPNYQPVLFPQFTAVSIYMTIHFTYVCYAACALSVFTWLI